MIERESRARHRPHDAEDPDRRLRRCRIARRGPAAASRASRRADAQPPTTCASCAMHGVVPLIGDLDDRRTLARLRTGAVRGPAFRAAAVRRPRRSAHATPAGRTGERADYTAAFRLRFDVRRLRRLRGRARRGDAAACVRRRRARAAASPPRNGCAHGRLRRRRHVVDPARAGNLRGDASAPRAPEARHAGADRRRRTSTRITSMPTTLRARSSRRLYRGRPNRAYNVSDDSDMKMGAWFDTVADAFHLPRPPRVGWEEAERQIAPMLLSFMSESRRLSNARMKRELRVRLRHADAARCCSHRPRRGSCGASRAADRIASWRRHDRRRSRRARRKPTLVERLDAYERLMRLDKPIGTLLLLWPTLSALWLAADGAPQRFAAADLRRRHAGDALGGLRDERLGGPRFRRARRAHRRASARSGRHRALGGAGGGRRWRVLRVPAGPVHQPDDDPLVDSGAGESPSRIRSSSASSRCRRRSSASPFRSACRWRTRPCRTAFLRSHGRCF